MSIVGKLRASDSRTCRRARRGGNFRSTENLAAGDSGTCRRAGVRVTDDDFIGGGKGTGRGTDAIIFRFPLPASGWAASSMRRMAGPQVNSLTLPANRHRRGRRVSNQSSGSPAGCGWLAAARAAWSARSCSGVTEPRLKDTNNGVPLRATRSSHWRFLSQGIEFGRRLADAVGVGGEEGAMLGHAEG